MSQDILVKQNSGVEPWRVYLAISQLYAQLGDLTQARGNADLALQGAPASEKPNVQAWIDQLAQSR